ncbi:MAG: hypothetical protein HFJ51_00340 [Clostridia bacterium]|nr:hypothetical protein [Clostridia bacterium]
MIPTYNIENLTGGLDIMLQNTMQIGFTASIIILSVWIILSLLIWCFGAKKKSEKMIKFGIRNFIITLVLIIMILAVPILFNMF